MLTKPLSIDSDNSAYLDLLRGMIISIVVLAHLGLSWVLPPYSGYILTTLPVLFFVSGAVSLLSFHRSSGISNFLSRRIISISAPYLVIVSFAFCCLWIIKGNIPDLNLYTIYQWLTFNPVAVSSSMPFPLGQVWFLHVLVIISIISPFVFHYAKSTTSILLIPVAISLVACSIQNFIDIGSYFMLDKHNLFQVISNMGFYFLGAYFYQNKAHFTNTVLYCIIALLSLIAIILALFVNTSNALPDHSYNPDLYYLLVCYIAIFALLLLQKNITAIVEKLSFLKKSLFFASYHSYSLYILHTFFIFMSEEYMGLKGVMGDPLLASSKIAFVVIGTVLLSIPVSYIAKKLTVVLRQYLT